VAIEKCMSEKDLLKAGLATHFKYPSPLAKL